MSAEERDLLARFTECVCEELQRRGRSAVYVSRTAATSPETGPTELERLLIAQLAAASEAFQCAELVSSLLERFIDRERALRGE